MHGANRTAKATRAWPRAQPVFQSQLAVFKRPVKSQNTKDEWPFADPKNVAVFTTTQVFRLRKPILHVSHDGEDGAWQFHSGEQQVSAGDAMIVALNEMVEHDPTICELADLQCGWFAERDGVGSPWRRVQR